MVHFWMFIDNKSINFWGTKSARPPTGALPLDPAGSALQPRPPTLSPGKNSFSPDSGSLD